jgi:hypothetical protein
MLAWFALMETIEPKPGCARRVVASGCRSIIHLQSQASELAEQQRGLLLWRGFLKATQACNDGM